MSERRERCETCRFWDSPHVDQQEDGLCRRHAPRCFPRKEESETLRYPRWPLTLNDEWCGEWQPLDPPLPTQETT